MDVRVKDGRASVPVDQWRRLMEQWTGNVHGYCIVCFRDGQSSHVDTYSGGYGDIYATREEGEDVLYLTRATANLHRPGERYDLAEIRVIPIEQGEERRARPGDPFYEEPVGEEE